MNFNELDRLLTSLTPEEAENRNFPGKAADYHMLSQVNIHNTAIPILDTNHLHEVLGDDRYFAVHKNPRYLDIPSHVHEWIEMVYVYSGSCEQVIDGITYQLTQGDLCMIDTGTVHSVRRCETNDILINLLLRREYFTSHFLSRFSGKSLISEFIADAISRKTESDHYIMFHSKENQHLHTLLQELMNEYFSPGIHSDDVIASYLSLLFLELMRMEAQNLAENREFRRGISVISILQYIDQNSDTATLAKAAQLFSLNPSYLSTCLKQQSGYSFGELLRKSRVKQAIRLLSSTTCSVTEIARMCGYENISYFYRIFEQETGMKPAKYRKQTTL